MCRCWMGRVLAVLELYCWCTVYWESTAFSPDKSLLEKVNTSVVIVNLTGYSSCNKDGSR